VITGVEISCNESGREIHVLGYHLDPDNDRLRSFEESFRADRDRRARSIVDNLRAQQVDITYDAVLEESKGGLIGRPHIAEVLVNKGYVSSIKKAFDRYLATDRPAYVARAPFTVAQAVELIRSSGGVAVIAHPHRMYMNPKTFLRLISSGIDGVEVYHPSHWPLTADFYRTLAERHHLLITGGSDFHGNREYDERNFGTVGATKQMVEALHIRALQRTLHGR
jgi:3',5'-nucleoside bisphosphate phosphatase